MELVFIKLMISYFLFIFVNCFFFTAFRFMWKFVRIIFKVIYKNFCIFIIEKTLHSISCFKCFRLCFIIIVANT